MRIIAQILAFYFFIGSWIPNSDFRQLTHLVDLVEHYELHVKEAQETGVSFSLWEFVNVHVFSPDGHQHDEDSNSTDGLCHLIHIPITLAFSTFENSISSSHSSISLENLFYKNSFHLNGFIIPDVQPPSHI